jgi:uncharacterized OB-fold protein
VEWFPPTPTCPRCASLGTDLRESAGCSEIYSWVVVNRALHPAFAQAAPYVILTVDLEGAARMVGRLLAADANDHRLAAGAAMEAEFHDVEGHTLVGFAFDGEER